MKRKGIKSVISCFLAAAVLIGGYAVFENSSRDGVSIAAMKNSETKKVFVGGFPFGVKFLCDGVMIIEITDIKDESGNESSPADEAGLEVNDLIVEANGQKINSNEVLSEIIENSTEPVELAVKRNQNIISVTLNPKTDRQGIRRAGMWIRDSAAGIGTVSYIDPQTNVIAGLGHGIYDSETGALMPLESGEVCKASITTVTKSQKGTVGGLNGYFSEETLGELEANEEIGIYADCRAEFENASLTEVADISMIETGKATVITTVNETTPKAYEAEIQTIDRHEGGTKNMIIKITDEDLLRETGGIVQGMSGSPILQNGRLVGVVTHVLVNSPEKGYAVFAQKMIEKYDEISENLKKCAA